MAVATQRQVRYTKADWTDFQRTGPGTLAGRFMRMFWQPVYRSHDLPRARAMPLKIMSDSLTLYRGESGEAHAVAFRCAHRGTQLSTGWVEGDEIRCRYHGWKYDASGQCVEQPVEVESFAQKVRIRSYPTQEYLGMVFVYMGEGEAPTLPRYPEFDDSPWLSVTSGPPKLCDSNYFRRVEHIGDEGHTMFTHYWRRASELALPKPSAKETDWGVVHRWERPEGLKMNHYLVPTMMYSLQRPAPPEEGPRLRIMWNVPIDDDHYWHLGVLLLRLQGEAAESYLGSQADNEAGLERADSPGLLRKILAGEMTIEDVADRADATHLEDEVILGGMGLVDEGPFHDQFGPTDAFVIAKRRIWERELRALAQGHPLKQWKAPERFPVSLRPSVE